MATPAQTPSTGRGRLTALLTDQLGWLAMRSLQILVVIGLAALLVVALVQLKVVVIPVLIALILSAAISPVVRWLAAKKVPKMLATWITLIAGALIFGGVVWLISSTVSNQWDDLVESASNGVAQINDALQHLPFSISNDQLESMKSAVGDFLTSSQFGSGAIAGVSAVASVITGFLLTLVILFYFLKDGDRIWAFILTPFSGERYARGVRVGQTTQRVLGGYVRGTATIALVDAIGIGAVLLIMQVPLAIPLTVVVFVGAFIPIVGATLAGTLAALVALVDQGLVVALIVVAVVVAVNQLEGNLLQPVVMAQSLKLHPLVVLVALTGGTVLAGIIGAVLAVPIVAAAWAIIKTWNVPADPEVLASDAAAEPARPRPPRGRLARFILGARG
ncbi:AI-2E family transporter [Mycetocola reblochoni]|uniref:AI-2E family transporter n=1 Tax=Mycetocola reblochoni TaxID=331618 RepID=UPI003F99EC9E